MKKLQTKQLRNISGGRRNFIQQTWYYISQYGTQAILSHGTASRKYGVGYLTHT